MANGPTYDSVLCRLTFKLARKHTWAQQVPIDVFLQQGFTQAQRQLAENNIIPDIKRGQIEFIGFQRDSIWLRGDKHDAAAEFLRDECGYKPFRIAATLPRFDGFD